MLGYIRDNIYKKYPYKKLSKSSLLLNFRLEQVDDDIEYMQAGIGTRIKLPYKWNRKYKLFFKDDLIVELSNLEIKAFDSKNNKEYLELRNKQSKIFK